MPTKTPPPRRAQSIGFGKSDWKNHTLFPKIANAGIRSAVEQDAQTGYDELILEANVSQ